uniref:lipocalin family protein n=1 Tax=uncultured Christiangramia sp. TaxID=503836 RepID=UPI0026375732|nr:lipocalin family protein [uncultured Christiangramia sp.]
MKQIMNVRLYCCLLFAGFLFQSCSKEDIAQESQLKISNATTVTTADMVGSWDLTKMMADVEVDLNSTPGGSKNLLDETDCFNTMSITFDANGMFISNNASMSFESGDGDDFSCSSDRMDSGTWNIVDNKLVLNISINGSDYTHEKAIDLGSDTFAFDVTKIESDQYVNDPGNTRASEIRILMLEYTRAK